MKQKTEVIEEKRETVRGVVVPDQWDDQFQVTMVHIACKGEREVRVANLDRFPSLLSFSQTEAIVTGILTRDAGKESIVIESFTPLGEL